jgi:galactose mutarotase-like enzyme
VPSGVHSLENDQLELVLTQDGGKLIRLLDRRMGRDWLLPSQAPDGSYLQPIYGDDYSHFDTSGFDECLPNISEGPHPGEAIWWPDHGEVWSRPWCVERDGDGLACHIKGQAWPYIFHRRLSLNGDSLRLDYSLKNFAPKPFRYLWSAHPLLRVAQGMKILLPESVREVFVNWASNPALGSFGEMLPWPNLASSLDFSIVENRGRGLAVKLFVPSIQEGWCSLVDPDKGHALTFTWNTAQVPHLGLWLCYGGWPTDGRPGHLTVALEPCSGMPDLLHEAERQGRCPVLQPGEQSAWSLQLCSHFI